MRIFSLCSLCCHFLHPRQKLFFAEFDTDCFTGQFVTWLRFPSLSASVSGLAPVLDFTAGPDFLVT